MTKTKRTAGMGHDIRWWPEQVWSTGPVYTILADLKSGVLHAGADPRRAGPPMRLAGDI